MGKRILDKIKSPTDLSGLSMKELNQLSAEMHNEIIRVVAKNGGHLAPNLGIIDLTIALHRVFRAPKDKIIFDVGHQAYPHKMLTGRQERFDTVRLSDGISGFTKSDESEYDPFGAGHAGTAISAAMGFSAANELKKRRGEHGEHVVAVVGDGALICGPSLEALNNVRSTCKNLIIVINDNRMSISRSIGAIPNYLNSLITGRSYNKFKAFTKMAISRLPAGNEMIKSIKKLELSTKSLFVPGVFFEEMGLRYIGPINGHHISEIIETFERIKYFNRPVIVHVITEKGHGCDYAKDSPEKFHGTSKFDPDTGESLLADASKQTFTSVFGETLVGLAEKNPDIVAITAAMCSGTGLSAFAKRFKSRFFDVGIAEEHAAIFAAGLAAAGLRPVVAVYASFLQRALDCVFHDICLQNLPVVFCVDRAGIVEDGPTHHGIYDTSFLTAMPNLSIMMPRNEQELAMMMPAAIDRKEPVAIRYPRGSSGAVSNEKTPPAPLEWGKAEMVRHGDALALWCLGREVYTGLRVADILLGKYGIECAVINARFLKPFDSALLTETASKMPVVTIEDNCKTGGLASLAEKVLVQMRHNGFMSFGWDAGQMIPHGSVEKTRSDSGMLPEQIAEVIAEKFAVKK